MDLKVTVNKLDSLSKQRKEMINNGKKIEASNIEQEMKGVTNQLIGELRDTAGVFTANCLRYSLGLYAPNNNVKTVYNYLKESSGVDGGYVVPTDVQEKVKELRKNMICLENYVNVEPVASNTGSRTIEVLEDMDQLQEVDEGGKLPMVDTEKIKQVDYEITKKAGIVKVSEELFYDSTVLINWLQNWAAKKTGVTRNFYIMKAAISAKVGKEIDISTYEELHNEVYKLNTAYRDKAIVVVNETGAKKLRELKCVDGVGATYKKAIAIDPVSKKEVLFDKFIIVELPDKQLPNTDTGKCRIFVGDLIEGITLFDRERISVSVKEMAVSLEDTCVLVRLKDCTDMEVVDDNAFIELLI